MAGNYNLGTAAGRILIDGAGAEIGFGIAQQAGQQFFDAIEQQLQGLKDFGQNLMKVGAVGAAGFVVAGNAAAAFEQRLSAVKAVSGATEAEMDAISEAAMRIGAETSFSATEAASAFEELVKAGISVQDTLDGAAIATANLAAAGEIALPRAAEIAANAMNNFNLAGSDMPKIADLVAGAANASAISVEEFAQSLSQVGAVANLAGVSFDDTAVAIAEMGNAGIKGSDAGTSLKTMLMNLQPVTKAQVTEFEKLGLLTYDAEDAMKSLATKGITPVSSSLQDVRGAISDYLEETQGIKDDTKEMGKAVDEWLMKNAGMQNAFFDSEGKAKGLADMQGVLAEATKGMTEEQKLASLETLFGADAIRAAAIMAKNGTEGFNELAASMGKVTAASVAETRLDNVRGSIEKLKGSFETLLIQIGSIFLPTVKKMIDGLTAFVTWLTTASERARNFFVSLGVVGTGLSLIVGALLTAVAVLGPWLLKMAGIALIQKIIMSLVGAFGYFRSILAASAGPITFYMRLQARMATLYAGITGAAATASTAVGIFGRVLAFALGPWGKLIQLAVALVAMGVVLYNTWQPFTDLVDGISAIIGGALSAAMSGLQSVIGTIVSGFQSGTATGEGFTGFLQSLGAVAAVVWADMQRLAALFMENVVPALEQLWGILQSAFGDAFGQIGAVVQKDLLPALQTLGETFVNDLFPALQQVGAFLLPIVGFILQVGAALIGILYTNLITIASFILGTVLPVLIQFAGPVLGFLISAITALAGFIITYLITPFINFITFLAGTVIPAIISFGSMLFGVIGGAFNFIGEVIGNVITWLSDFVSGIVTFFTAAKSSADAGVSGFQSAFQGIADFFIMLGTAVSTVVMTIVNAVVSGFTAVLTFLSPFTNLLGEIFVAMWNVVAAIFNGVVGLLLAIVQFLWGSLLLYFQTQQQILTEQWNAFWAVVNAVFAAFAAALAAGWSALWAGIMAIVQPVLDWLGAVIPACWAVITAAIAAGQEAIWGIITGAWNGLMAFINMVSVAIQTLVAIAWNQLVADINGAMQLAQSIIAAIWSGIQGIFSGAVGWLNAITGGGFSQMVSTIQNAMGALGSAISNKWNEILGFFHSIPGTIQGIFSGAASWLGNAGRQIIDGFLGGLRSAAGAITDFFAGLTASIPQIKGPPEHDKVMLIPAGKMIMKSLYRGLDAEKDSIFDLLNDMNATIPATINAVLSPDVGSLALETMRQTSRPPVNPLNIVNNEAQPKPGDQYMVDKLIVNNPEPEKASESLPKAIRRLSTVGSRSK